MSFDVIYSPFVELKTEQFWFPLISIAIEINGDQNILVFNILQNMQKKEMQTG